MEGVPAKAVLGVVRGLGAEGAAVSGWGAAQDDYGVSTRTKCPIMAACERASSQGTQLLLSVHRAAAEEGDMALGEGRAGNGWMQASCYSDKGLHASVSAIARHNMESRCWV